mgnify:CR=1 FL=1
MNQRQVDPTATGEHLFFKRPQFIILCYNHTKFKCDRNKPTVRMNISWSTRQKQKKFGKEYSNLCHKFKGSTLQGPKGGPRSPEISAEEPGALPFYWLEPWSLFGSGARSPKTFCVEPGAQHFQVWSFGFPDCVDSWLLPFCVCLVVHVNRHKETESEERTVHNTSISGYLSL